MATTVILAMVYYVTVSFISFNETPCDGGDGFVTPPPLPDSLELGFAV